MMPEIKLSDKEWETLRDGWADIACWFMGFKAAHIDTHNLELPPQLEEVSNLMTRLKSEIHHALPFPRQDH